MRQVIKMYWGMEENLHTLSSSAHKEVIIVQGLFLVTALRLTTTGALLAARQCIFCR